jgi:pyruvate/2-oxoglutarate dehydrogenase complex dihydrolipoamide acyltransferase (E2) component
MPKSPFDDSFDPKGEAEVKSEGKAAEVLSAATATPPAPPIKSAPRSVAPPLPKGPVVPHLPAPATQAALVGQPLAPVAGLDNSAISQLLQYMILKEGREAAEDQAKQDRFNHLRKQRERNAKDQDNKTLVKQARCKHLKGGKKGPKTQNKDYAVYQHRFIAFTTYIRCRICGMKWFPKDTIEYLIRVDKNDKERKISNHTRIGWREAVDLCDSSTDTQTASESIPNVSPNSSTIDAYGQQFEGRFVDKETGEAIEGVQL